MATAEEVEEFLAAYTGSWEPMRDWSKHIFHPGGGIRHPGTDGIVNPDTPPSPTDQLRQLFPDLKVRLVSWASRDDVVYAEWELSFTLGERSLKIPGVNRFNLKGNKATDSVAYIDRLGIVESLDPSHERTTIGMLLARAARSAR